MCKFLIQLSMDFSSYYNRVHILGVSCMSQAGCWRVAALPRVGPSCGVSAGSRLQSPSGTQKQGEEAANVRKYGHHPLSLPFSLQEPFPHLFDQMFARLQLLGAVRDVFHHALATLHLPPLSQI